MSSRLFGTDGVRGVFGRAPLVREIVAPLAREVARDLVARSRGATPRVVVGGDTRFSTAEIAGWVADGLAAGGAATLYAGVVPTPAVAWLARTEGAAAGVAVSASHNPAEDNGVKLLDDQGAKWSDADERELERRLAAAREPVPVGSPPAVDGTLAHHYLAALAATLPGGRPLAGLRVALDAANGATAPFAGELFADLGAHVTIEHASPDGRNINRGCGSTHPEVVAAATAASRSHVGAAFDGDGDRAILADERGAVLDGDAILYVWARGLQAAGALQPACVVATSMSNLGLEVALRRDGIEVVRCDVGDRAVGEAMRRHGAVLGGEQSGHIVCAPLGSTGDGMLTALQVCGLVAACGRPLSELAAGFQRFPQLLRNVRVARKPPLAELPRVRRAAADVEARLGGDGRLLLRYSGTEPLARIMIEGPEQAAIEAMADELAAVLVAEIGASS